MSAPRNLDVHAAIVATRIPLRRGSMAALRATPDEPRGTAVLVPGFTGSKEDFLHILAPLADVGWDVIAIDQLGQHESDQLGTEEAYALDLVAADLVELLGTLSGPVHLLGHSYGGLVGRAAVLAGAPVASYVHLCSGAGPIPTTAHERLSLLRAVVPAMSLDAVYAAAAELDRQAGVPARPADVEEFMHRRFVANDPQQLRAAAATLMSAVDTTDDLATRVDEGLRVLVAYGEADDAWPLDEQDRLAQALGGTAIVIPSTGHSPAVDDPEATTAMLDRFWSAS